MLTRGCVCSVLVACSKPNSLFCDVDTECAGTSLSFCDLEGIHNEEGLTNTCVADPQDGSCNLAEQNCGPNMVCKDDPDDGLDGICVDCLDSIDCPSDAPFCDVADNSCRTPNCEQNSDGDALCMGMTPATPYCGPNDQCAECTDSSHCSSDSRPTCDPTTGECRKCEAHAECVSGVCDVDDGTCRAEANIVYLDDGGINGSQCGTIDSACATFGGADGALSKLGGSRDTIVVQQGSIVEQVAISSSQLNGVQLTIVGQPGAELAPSLLDSQFAIAVTNNATVAIDSFRISAASDAASSVGVRCTGGSTLTLKDSVIDNIANGVSTNNCNLTLLRSDVRNSQFKGMQIISGEVALHQSTIADNAGGGIVIEDASYEIVNCLISHNGNNGNSGSTFGGVQLRAPLGNQRFEFNTVVGNSVALGIISGSAIDCPDSNLDASNNIFALDGISPGDSKLIGDLCSVDYSLIEGGRSSGQGNMDGTPSFVSATNDYHLAAGSRGIDEAVGGAQVRIDIDGDARPQGSARDMGADEVLVD